MSAGYPGSGPASRSQTPSPSTRVRSFLGTKPGPWRVSISRGPGVASRTVAAGVAGAGRGASAAVLAASVAGLKYPVLMAPVLVVQVLYKGLWLAGYAWPRWRRGEALPVGLCTVFLAIVLTWPVSLGFALFF